LAFVRTLIHIGLPRTASTFLQKQVFPLVRGFDFIGVDKTFYAQSFQKLLYQDESLYKELTRKDLVDSDAENILLSNELFCGQSFGMNATNRTRTAERLKKAFPEGEIILMLRNQLSLLESLYAIGIYSGVHKKPEDFFVFGTDTPRYDTFSGNEHLETYLLYPLIKLYKDHFEKVHIFLFEDFKSNQELFLENFKSKLDLSFSEKIPFKKKENKSLGQRQIKYIRRINRAKSLLEWNKLGKSIFRHKLWFGEHVLGGTKRFSFDDELSTRIKNFYCEDNEALAQNNSILRESENFQRYYKY